ncbi:hypothetical protein AB0D49_04560 [Streptomyces sp. NPDC048290]|uniref:hypothetical protein n=1 Tax=Streptomyces sp. NPDC048290 TaxID=3155811 RepID=UPI00341DA55B
MSGDEPYAGHDGTLLLLLLLAGCAAVLILTVQGVKRLLRARRPDGPPVWTGAALLVWDAAVALYVWGLLHLLLTDDYGQAQSCRDAVGDRLTGYDPGFMPLRFGCRTADGTTVDTVVPSYLDPALAVLALGALALTGLALAHHRRTPSRDQ